MRGTRTASTKTRTQRDAAENRRGQSLAAAARRPVSRKAIEQHVRFLEETLIPDLRDGGRDSMADDFALCVTIIRQLGSAT